ncbi:MAG TPA: AIR synthase-related protein [Anaerolineales bacterium]|nr:AIR synthase-related protein [Anaerolineales bacterium]
MRLGSYFNALYLHLDKVKALAHLTGGGFVENIPRILPENLNAVIHHGSWQVPPVWKLIQMGIGMVVIVDKTVAADFQSSILEPTFVIGELVEGEQKVILN